MDARTSRFKILLRISITVNKIVLTFFAFTFLCYVSERDGLVDSEQRVDGVAGGGGDRSDDRGRVDLLRLGHRTSTHRLSRTRSNNHIGLRFFRGSISYNSTKNDVSFENVFLKQSF